MKPTIYVLLAISFFAIQNIKLETRLSECHPVILALAINTTALAIAIFHLSANKGLGLDMTGPTLASTLPTIILVATVTYIGQFFFLSAYTSGGKATVITTIILLLPVLVSIIKYLTAKELPSTYHIIGYTLAVASVIFLSKGNSATTNIASLGGFDK
jgi:drug/metabolite transporter (DMT)-like permease